MHMLDKVWVWMRDAVKGVCQEYHTICRRCGWNRRVWGPVWWVQLKLQCRGEHHTKDLGPD